MENFWDYKIWSGIITIVILLAALLAGKVIKKYTPGLSKSLIPTSVIAGSILVIISGIYRLATGDVFFDTPVFGGNGTMVLETITYHTLALGFIASTFKKTKGKMTKKRTTEIFNTGVTTVSSYLLQGVVGLGITIIAAFIVTDFFSAAGLLLPFGYGQGSGQALNYGGIYENDFGFVGGKSFGLAIAALGFLSASIGGVIHINLRKRTGRLTIADKSTHQVSIDPIEGDNEIPMQESVDKMTIQLALIGVAYLVTYLIMYGLGLLLPSMKSVIFGFNFIIGVLSTVMIKGIMGFLRKKNIMRRDHTNDFLMTRASNLFYDIMVVAGIAAIRIDVLGKYWLILLILGAVGLVVTYVYNRIVARALFKEYEEEQFLVMYGMLTGTASTGIILLREIDEDFKTPAADNLVYQNFPAIVFGFPIMLLATLAPTRPILTLIILFAFFIAMNILLFRSFIFKRKKKNDNNED